jgi:hypothetical protein
MGANTLKNCFKAKTPLPGKVNSRFDTEKYAIWGEALLEIQTE